MSTFLFITILIQIIESTEYDCGAIDCHKEFVFNDTTPDTSIYCAGTGECDDLVIYYAGSSTLSVHCSAIRACVGMKVFCGDWQPITAITSDITCHIHCESPDDPACVNVEFSCKGPGQIADCWMGSAKQSDNLIDSTMECNIGDGNSQTCELSCLNTGCQNNNLLCHTDSNCYCDEGNCGGGITTYYDVTYSPTTSSPTTKIPTKQPTKQPSLSPSNIPTKYPTYQTLICPVGSTQIGDMNADIYGCGLEECDERYSQLTIDECYTHCVLDINCKAFNWASIGGDTGHPQYAVCTIYSESVPTTTWGPNQIFCRIDTEFPTKTPTSFPSIAPIANTEPTTDFPTTSQPTPPNDGNVQEVDTTINDNDEGENEQSNVGDNDDLMDDMMLWIIVGCLVLVIISCIIVFITYCRHKKGSSELVKVKSRDLSVINSIETAMNIELQGTNPITLGTELPLQPQIKDIFKSNESNESNEDENSNNEMYLDINSIITPTEGGNLLIDDNMDNNHVTSGNDVIDGNTNNETMIGEDFVNESENEEEEDEDEIYRKPENEQITAGFE